MKNFIVFILVILLFGKGCTALKTHLQTDEENLDELIEDTLFPILPEGYEYRKYYTFIDSLFWNPIMLPKIRVAVQRIQNLEKELEICNTHIKNYEYADRIYSLQQQIEAMRIYIRKQDKKHHHSDLLGWRITHCFYLSKEGKDTLTSIGLIVDKNFSDLLVDEILTEDAALSYCKYKETIQECMQK